MAKKVYLLRKLRTQCLIVKQAIKQLLWKPVNFTTLMQLLTSIQHTFNHAITSCCNYIYFTKLGNSLVLSPESMKTLVRVFVTSHLDYCNSLLFGIPKYQTDRLQKVVNNIARLIFRIPKFDHISSNLSHLHREEYLQPHSISGHHLRSCDQSLLKIPKTNF